VAYRLLRFAFVHESIAQVIVGFGIVRVQSQGFSVMVHGLRHFALARQGITEIIVGYHVAGSNPQGFGIVVDSLLEVALAHESITQVGVRPCLVGRFHHTIAPERDFVRPQAVTFIRPDSIHERHSTQDYNSQPRELGISDN
jgi:hypothetical protein